MTHRAMRMVFAASLSMRSCIGPAGHRRTDSSFRLQHGEIRSPRTDLNRIALEQARAMAAKEKLDHASRSFSTRMRPRRRRAAETSPTATTIREDARPVDRLERAPQEPPASQSHPHRLASAKTQRAPHLLAMEIAGDYNRAVEEEKAREEAREAENVSPSAKRKPAASKCHINLLGLCI